MFTRCIESIASGSLYFYQETFPPSITYHHYVHASPIADPAPMTHWRGQPLTHELAEDLFIGWLPGGPGEAAGAAAAASTTAETTGAASAAKNGISSSSKGAAAAATGGPAGAGAAAEAKSGSSSSSNTRPWSWLIAAGKNPAYDYFPCQHQLFYRGKGRGQFWYEPVFKAITLDGEEVGMLERRGGWWGAWVHRARLPLTPGTKI